MKDYLWHHVPEESLPIVKLVYNFMSRKIDPKILREAQQAMLPQHFELSDANFENYLNKIKEDAKKNSDKRILFIVFGASHGFMEDGFQVLATN